MRTKFAYQRISPPAHPSVRKKTYSLGLVFVIILFFFAQHTFAAELFLQPTSTEKTGESAIRVSIDTDTPVNTIQVAIEVPKGYEYIRSNDGGSVIGAWVDKPEYDANKRVISFSGIIPGGFSGKDKTLLTFFVSGAAKTGFFSFIGKETSIYEHSSEPVILPVLHKPLSALAVYESQKVVQGKQIEKNTGKENFESNTARMGADKTPPRNLDFYISHDAEMLEGKYFIAFSAQDDNSGIEGFFIAERSRPQVSDYSLLAWVPAESPFILSDQDRNSFVYIKAIDRAGNGLVGVIPPRNPLFPPLTKDFFGIISLLCIMFLFGVLWYFYLRRSSFRR